MMWRWDAPYYAAIAINGYGWQYGQWHGSASFFPAYPLLLRPFLALFQITDRAVALGMGILVSNLFLVAFVIMLDRLVRLDDGDDAAHHVRWLIWTSPMSIFFVGMYTESMFMFMCVVALYYSRQDNWLLASLGAFLAGLTRPLGVVLALPLLYESWRAGFQHRHLLGVVAPPWFVCPLCASGWLAVRGVDGSFSDCQFRMESAPGPSMAGFCRDLHRIAHPIWVPTFHLRPRIHLSVPAARADHFPNPLQLRCVCPGSRPLTAVQWHLGCDAPLRSSRFSSLSVGGGLP